MRYTTIIQSVHDRRRVRWCFELGLLVFFILSPTCTYSQTSEYEVKAVLLGRIAQYIEWPQDSTNARSNDTIVISVLGKNPFGTILNKVYAPDGQKIKEKIVRIRYIQSIRQIETSQILFIATSEKGQLKEILQYIKNKPILTIGDTNDFGEAGVHLNFYLADNKTRFELNESSANTAGLQVDYRLRAIAKIVDH